MKALKVLNIEFKEFMNKIDENLIAVKNLIGVEKISFNYVEIDNLMKLYENNFENPQALNLNYNEFEEVFYSYVGEAFIYHCGGNWGMSILKNDEAYGTPIILNWGKDGESHGRISLWVWKTLIERGQFKGTISEKIKLAQLPWD